jgi:hypothetical protein
MGKITRYQVFLKAVKYIVVFKRGYKVLIKNVNESLLKYWQWYKSEILLQDEKRGK